MGIERGSKGRDLLRTGLVLAGVAVGSVTLAACGGDDDEKATTAASSTASTAASSTGGKPGEGKTIGLNLIGVNEYVTGVATGVLKSLVPEGYEVKILSSNFTADDEVKNFQSFISQKVDGIITLPVTSASSGRGTLMADKAGIPTVSLGWNSGDPADDLYAGRLRYNYTRDTQLIADWLDENVEPAEVVIVQGAPGNPTSDQFDTVEEKINKLGNGWKVVGKVPGQYMRDKSITAAENLFQAHPNAKVILNGAAEMGVGIASFLERKGMDDVTHITSDGNEEMFDWFKKGFISANLFLSSGTQGQMGGDLMRKRLEENAPNAEPVDIPMSMETAETIESAVEKQPMSFEEFMPQVKSAL